MTQQTATNSEALLSLQQGIVDRVANEEPLDRILDDLCQMVEAFEPGVICSLMRLDPESGLLFVQAAPGAPQDLVDELDGLEPGALAGSCGSAVYSGHAAIVEDVLDDPRWESLLETAVRFGIRSCWSVPIRAGRSRIVGTFAITSTEPRRLEPAQVRLLETAAHLSAIAIVHDECRTRMEEQQHLLKGILEGIEDPIFVKDEKLQYVLANSAEMRGVTESAKSFVGADDYELYPHKVAERGRGIDRLVLREGESQHYEETFENGVEGTRTFLIRKSPLRDEEGQTRGVIGVARDITELRQAEQAFFQSQKLESLGVLAGGIAHDFNNILTAILGGAECALLDAGLSGAARENLEVVRRSALRAAELTHQMLAYAGKADADKRPVPLPELLEEVLELIKSSISKQARLSIDVEESLPAIHADAAQIRQLLMNLVTNASEALIDGSGEVSVEMRLVERLPEGESAASLPCVKVSVTDTGRGMNEQTVARIFDPFFTTKFAGRGLGLAAVQGIVRGHGGFIQVSSQLARGTTFEVYLPASTKEPEGEKIEGAESWTGQGTILVIEDEESILRFAERTLRDSGLRALCAVDGREGVEVFSAHRDEVDAILLDWTTSHLSGEEVLAKLRALGPDVPIVVTSGHSERTVTQDVAKRAFADFLKKPYTPAQLRAAMRRTLERSDANG